MSHKPIPLSDVKDRAPDVRVHPHGDELLVESVPRRAPVWLSRQDLATRADVPLRPSMPRGIAGVNTTPHFYTLPQSRVIWRGKELDPLGGIYPPDGRKPYFDLSYPWRCVCRVMNRKGAGCGVLIGPRHVLTASHVIDWDGPMETVLIAQSGVILASATATDVVAFERIHDVSYSSADDDYAVIILDSSLGVRLGWFGVRTYDAAWDDETDVWCNIAHAPDIGAGVPPVFQTGFFLDEDEWDVGGGRMLESETIDLVKGMSGSPVFGFWSDGPYAVGVVSATASGAADFNAIAAGSNLTKLASEARSVFP